MADPSHPRPNPDPDETQRPDPDETQRSARVRAVLDIALHRYLAVRLLDAEDPAAGIAFPVTGGALNDAGLLHGGVVTALLDVASYLALLPALAAGEKAVTHDLSASLLRPVASGADVQVRGRVVRKGRTVAFLRSEAFVDGLLVATAQVTKSVLQPREDRPPAGLAASVDGQKTVR